jgi:hypothetical protein
MNKYIKNCHVFTARKIESRIKVYNKVINIIVRAIIINMALKTLMLMVSRSLACSLSDYGTSNQAVSIFRITRIIVGYCGDFELNGGTMVPRASQ